jgi:predicted Zn-dependent protease
LKILGIGIGMVAVMIVVAYLWVLPFVGDRVAMMIPVSAEEALGRAAVNEVTSAKTACRSAALDRIVDRLRDSDSPYTYRVTVVDIPEVNAFAAPGGHIVVFRGLIEKTGSPEELAAVLAHEIEHVEGRHGTRAILRSISFWALLSLVAGDSGEVLVQLAGNLGDLRYQRGDESEADRNAMRRIQRARIDPRGMLRAYRMLDRESAEMPQLVNYFSTHPRIGDRIGELERMAKESVGRIDPLLPGGQWPPALDCTPVK